MRILFIAGIFPPDIGGPANYIPLIAQGLIKNGHDVSVLCFSDNDFEVSDSYYPYKIVRIQRRQNFISRELKTIWFGLRMAMKSDVIYVNGNDFKGFVIGLLSGKPRVHKIVGDSAWERAQNKNYTQAHSTSIKRTPNLGFFLFMIGLRFSHSKLQKK